MMIMRMMMLTIIRNEKQVIIVLSWTELGRQVCESAYDADLTRKFSRYSIKEIIFSALFITSLNVNFHALLKVNIKSIVLIPTYS
jgi:hypothetical protein